MVIMMRKTNKIGLVISDEKGCWRWYHYWCAGEQDRLPDSELKCLNKTATIHVCII